VGRLIEAEDALRNLRQASALHDPATPHAEEGERPPMPCPPSPDFGFLAKYRALEARMKHLAEADGRVFVPNPEPVGPVEYVVICMEPSFGRWARSLEDGRTKVEAGFRNFIASIETSILRFCIQQYLGVPPQRYHITDLSKGAMPVAHASVARTERYDRWYGLLKEELDLVTLPHTRIVRVGTVVTEYLRRRPFPRPWPLTSVIHYSPLAAQARTAGIVGHEEQFAAFRGSVSLTHVRATTEAVLTAFAIPARFRGETLAQLEKGELSESQQQLIFNYKLAFEAMKESCSMSASWGRG
jgi:hypothetical protein